MVRKPFGGSEQSGLGREGGVAEIAPCLETTTIQGVPA